MPSHLPLPSSSSLLVAVLLLSTNARAPQQSAAADAFVVNPSSVAKSPSLLGSSSGSSRSTSIGMIGNIAGLFDEGKKKVVRSLAGDYDADAVRARMDGLIGDNPVLMFSFVTWPFCVEAKKILDAMGAEYLAIELDADPDGKAIRAEMADLVGRTSVPAIWIGKKFVGGCNDGPMGGLKNLKESGDLEGLLREVGSI